MAKQKGYGEANILVESVEAVDVRSLNMFHKNPRVGNVDKIAESLKKNGQFKPIVVNRGSLTGRPMEILAGNHTWLGTKRNGDAKVLAAYVDVDEDTATRINIADNKTADEGSYDDTILAELLASLPDAVGTGYSQNELDELINSIEVPDFDLGGDLPDAPTAADLGRKPKFEDAPLGDEDEAEQEPEPTPRMREEAAEQEAEEDTSDAVKDAPEFFPGTLQLQDDMDITQKGMLTGPWGIPAIRTDRLMQPDDVPADLDSWAGSATRDWPNEDQWWLYNYGVDSTSGMRDISKIILAFFTWDDYFEKWWGQPSKYTTKVINSSIKYIVTPDFSMDTEMPKAMCLYQLYRTRWLSRFFQEAGLTLLPHVTWPDGDIDFLRDYSLKTMPKHVPVLCTQLQTFDRDKVNGGVDHLKAQYDLIMGTLKPKVLVLYAGKPGYEWFRDNVELHGARLQWINTRQAKLSEKAKDRVKKRTL